jgi:hypothetical protein
VKRRSTRASGKCEHYCLSSFCLGLCFCFAFFYLSSFDRFLFSGLRCETVGGTFLQQHSCGTETHTQAYPCLRFVNLPIDTVNKRLTRESGEATAEISNLEKKLQYHEMTNQKSRENLEQILKSGGRA